MHIVKITEIYSVFEKTMSPEKLKEVITKYVDERRKFLESAKNLTADFNDVSVEADIRFEVNSGREEKKMKKIRKEELKDVLKKHKLFLQHKKGGKKADLSNTDLSNTDLTFTDLSYADLSNAKLLFTDLSNTDLSYANLTNADLSNANLFNTDFSNADLSNADLSFAKLSNANLFFANLSNIDISHVDFLNVDLSKVDLSNAKMFNYRLVKEQTKK